MLNIPFVEGNNSGILQYMKNNGLTSSFTFAYSSIFSSSHSPVNVLTTKQEYFTTVTNKATNANFIIIELIDRMMYPSGYVINSYPRVDEMYLKSWALYGSLIGNDWKKLHSVDNQDDLRNGVYGRYSLSNGPFRYFKVVQTGASAGTIEDDMYRMRIFYIDFFGIVKNFSTKFAAKTCKTDPRKLSFIISLTMCITYS